MPPLDADPRFGQFGLRSDCPSCGAHLPVNGPVERVPCADCGAEVKVPTELLAQLLEAFEEGWPRPPAADTVTLGDMTWRWTMSAVEAPACPACAGPLPGAGSTAEPLARCPTCAAAAPQGPVPASLRARVPSASWVLAGEGDARREPPPAPVALSCPSCGAGLSITSRHHRITPCQHCNSQVHLPDAVWRALHPPRKVEKWFVRFEGESRPARARRRALDEGERKRQQQEKKRQQQAEAEARDQARKAEQAAARAEALRQKAEAQAAALRRRAWIGAPLALLCGLSTLTAGALGSLAALLFAFGPGRFARLLGLHPAMAHFTNDGLVVGALVALLLGWLLGVAGATRWSGTSFFGVLAWSAFMLVLSLIPLMGLLLALFFAFQHFRGLEPTPDTTTRVPRLASVPLGLLHLGFPFLVYLAAAILGNTTFSLIPD